MFTTLLTLLVALPALTPDVPAVRPAETTPPAVTAGPPGPTVSPSGRTTDTLDIATIVAEALQNNPRIRAARHGSAAAATRVDQVTSWEAPRFGVELFQTPIRSFPDPFKGGMETDYFLEQMIPFPGKLPAMGRAAVNEAAMAREGTRALERTVVRDLKAAAYELYHIQRTIDINRENQTLMRRFADIAAKQYEVGRGSQPDILRAQTELSTLITEGVNLEKQRRVAEAMINTLLDRPTASVPGIVPEIEGEIPVWTFEEIAPLALEHRPELQAMRSGVGMRQEELSASERQYMPDLMVRVMYKDMAMTGEDFWSTMLGISIPIAPWAKGSVVSKVEENELNVKKAEEEYVAMRNMTLFEVQDALAGVQTSRNILALMTTATIPQAEQTLESTIAAYRTGRTEFLMVIDAYRMLLTARLDHSMAVRNLMTDQARLERAVGLDSADIAQRLQ